MVGHGEMVKMVKIGEQCWNMVKHGETVWNMVKQGENCKIRGHVGQLVLKLVKTEIVNTVEMVKMV